MSKTPILLSRPDNCALSRRFKQDDGDKIISALEESIEKSNEDSNLYDILEIESKSG